ncbi:hypothetical protein KC351_g12662 [Hortaea werneckii]|nr:hypothetical protein KC351_g12662 [Hortaea werneckii]
MRTRAQAADPTALDLPYLSTTFEVAEPDLQILLDAPTAELVKDFLTSLTSKGQEYDSLKAEKLKVDVELENTVRTSETKVRAQKAQVTKHAKEIEELRTSLSEAESAKENLASKLEQLRSSSSGSTAETSALRQRIETLEASNRDALALVESKSTEKDRLATELSEQHTKLLSLRREVSSLEEKNQSLENAASSQKFKEQSLQQEIDLLKRNNEWHSNELQTRTQEHAKFRKERNARIASLQRELEDSNASVETLKRTEATLRQRLEELQGKTDESFAKIASLQEEATRKEQDFRTELDSTKRLAELQAQSASTHKARLQEVQGQVDQIKDDAAEEIGRLQAEIETERSDKEASEAKVAELELQVEKLEQSVSRSRAGTPMRNGAGLDPSTPTRGGSPSGALPGSMRKSVNGLSFTQLYSNYMETKQELDSEKRRSAKLTEHLDELVTAVESRSPEILELKADQERLEQQVLEFSGMLDDANQNHQTAVKESQHWQNEAAASSREGELLRQQLRDLSAQIKMLLVEIQSREQGLGEMSAQERLELERAARGELTGGAEHDSSMTDTDRFINERLVIFHSVADLQNKNEQMLRLTRVLGERLEGDEAQEKERQTAAFANENEELRQKVQRLEDELQATVTQIDSYMKERDMFRRMLQHRGQLAPDADIQSMFGQSMGPPATPQRNGQSGLEPPTPRSKDVEDLNKLLKEQQSFFDQFRNESSTDRRMLKEQVDALAREKSNLQADVTRAQSQLQLAAERYEMLNSNFAALRNENSELAKRSQMMHENAAKQDLRTQQVAEELVEARSMADSLRNENANAKAEKDLWKRIEARLTEDNKNLMDERSRLNKLVTDLQNLQNERELAESETRRRLQTRTESIEAELNEIKKKLEHEVDESRKASLRREYEEGQSRTRIDDLVKSLGNVREELVAAKTVRDELKGRVEEMRIELRSAEEKVSALQPRPTPLAPAPQPEDNEQAVGEEAAELPTEQRLALEISELKRDLELARNELEAARQQVEQYRSIAQSTEEELANFNQTSEQYKEETDRLVAEKDAKIADMEQRIQDLHSELSSTSTEMSELRTKSEEASRVLDEQKAGFESELARLRDDVERHSEEKKMYQGDMKAQAEIAQQAQQSYEDELLKHAEAARSLQSVRKDYNDLRTEVAGIRAEAEAAKQSLAQGEESWEEQKDRFEKEIEDLGRKREELGRQNGVLHQQMESFSTELAALRTGRQHVPPAGNEGGEAGPPSKSSDGNLQEVIRFLRREKEIVDVQYELSIQESKRLQQQLDYTNGQFEDVRQKLADERRHSQEKTAAEGSTSKLMQTISELNLFREANTTLREEARVARVKLEENLKEVERLYAEIDPLKARVSELEGDLESKDGEMKLLQDDRDHWRERTNNVISKYGRADPEEIEGYKTKITELEGEKEKLLAEVAPLKEQVEQAQAKSDEAVEAERTQWQERIDRFKEQAKNQNRKQNGRIGELQAEVKQATEMRDQKEAELQQAMKELEEVKAKQTGGGEDGEVQESGEEHAALHARIAEAEKNAAEHAQRVEELGGEITAAQTRIKELEQQLEASQQTGEQAAAVTEGSTDQTALVNELQSKIAQLESQISELQQQLEAAQQQQTATEGQTSNTADFEARISELQQQLESAQQQQTGADQSAQVVELESKISDLEQKLETALAQSNDDDQSGNLKEVVTELETKVSELQTKLEESVEQKDAALAKAATTSEDSTGAEHPEVTRVREEKDKYIQQMEEQHALALQQKDEQCERKLQQQRENLRRQLAENKAKYQEEGKQELITQHSTEMQKVKEEHEEEVKKMKEAHAAEVEKLHKAGNAAVEDAAEAMSPVKTEKKVETGDAPAINLSDLTDEQVQVALHDIKESQVLQLLKTNEKAKTVLRRNIATGIEKGVAQKDEEIAKLKEAQGSAASEGDEDKVKELSEKLEAAQAEKEKAVQTAIENAEKKAKVQISQRDIANAKLNYVKKAATDTPEKPVKEVWEVAQTQKPPPKPTQVAVPPTASSPASKPAVPASPAQSQQTPQSPSAQNQASRAGSFGQPSAPTGSFGQPSAATPTPQNQGAALSQPARRPSGQQSNSPNPQAPSFTPGNSQNAGTGPAALQGLRTGIPQPGRGGQSSLPRAGGAAGRGGLSFQGAAGQQGQRGGMQSGLPRGGANAGRGGRGGSQIGMPRGGAHPNAGQKRSHDGSEGGDAKRSRGGGQGGGA